jgi:FtsP/CotA-like multicopper oxidase with cupredoxin domain
MYKTPLCVVLSALIILMIIPPLVNAQPMQVEKDDSCPKAPSKNYIQHWSCGNWEEINGEMRRVFRLTVNEHSLIDVGAPNGEKFQAWTFNGTIPGPTMRMTEGDKVTVYVYNPSNSTKPHSFHKHSIHESVFDGAGLNKTAHVIMPGATGQYFFDAFPYGVYPYHCHVDPVADHINRGLYGMLIIDPPSPRSEANEIIMLMNGYDFNYDQEGGTFIEMPERESEDEVEEEDSSDEQQEEEEREEEESTDEDNESEGVDEVQPESEPEAVEEERDNEIYTVNGFAFLYMHHPINIEIGKPVRIYLVNMLEFDLINSFHLHGGMFNYSSSGTYLSDQNKVFTDILTLGQGDRGIIEFTPQYQGTFMFHAHVNEFTDLGWMGFFQVNKPR